MKLPFSEPAHGIPRDALVVGFIGTFGQWHGVEFLAECIRGHDPRRAGVDQNREKIHFLLVGDGPQNAPRPPVCRPASDVHIM